MALTTVKSDQIQSSVALAGSPTTTTQSASDNSTKVATTAYVETAVANLVDSAPASLNTLDELAAALNDDASFSTTVTNSIATKLPLAGGTLTGALTGTTASFSTASTSASVFTLTDTGVAAYEVIFPDTSTYQLTTNTTSDKTFKVRNSGSGTFNLNVEGSVTATGATINGNVAISNSSGDTLTLTKSTTEPSLRIEGDSGKDFVITVSGELLTFTQNDGATDILTLDHDTGAATFTGFMGINKAAASSVALSVGADSTSSSSYGLEVTNASANTRFLVNGVGDSLFYKTNNALGMKFDASSGNVGVGKTAGAVRIDVETDLNGNLAGQFKNTHASGSYGIKVMGGHDSSNYAAIFTDKDNTTLLKIAGSGEVGIGSNEAHLYHSAANDLVIAGSGSQGMTIKSGTSNSGNIFFADGNSGNTAYRGYIQYQHNAPDTLVFGTSSADRLAIDGYGALNVINGSDRGFIDFDGSNLQLNTQRNPNTGTFANTGKTHAGITLAGGNGDSNIKFYTTSSNNTAGSKRMEIRKDGEVDIIQNSNAVGTFGDNIGEVGAGNFCLQIANSAGSALKPLGFRAEDIRFATGSATRMAVNSNGNVNIGMPSGYNAEGKLHVYKGAAGKSWAADGADQLIVENSSSVAIDMRTPNGDQGQILFSDDAARGRGRIGYYHGQDYMYFDTAGGLRLKIDQNGAVTKPSQPAFHARTGSSNTTMPVNAGHDMVNSVELFDQGGDYNTSNYQFTAPVTGKYQLNAYIRWNGMDTDASYYILYIITSNRDYYTIVDPDAFDADPDYYSMSFSVLADMDINDTTKVHLYQAGGAQVTTYDGGSGSNGFTGYLVA